MINRTIQELLADRRANVLESTRERDLLARKLLDAYIAEIDRELDRRHPKGAKS
jgi:hypothetical protein